MMTWQCVDLVSMHRLLYHTVHFYPVRIRRWINILNVGATADPEQFIKNMLNNCTLSLFVIGGCDIYTYF